MNKPNFKMRFDIGVIKHLGLQMYSTLPPVIAELVSNAWDADATHVNITIPTGQVSATSEIVVEDNGYGMSDNMVREAYLRIGRDRRKAESTDVSPKWKRKVMGRKGIGKFSAFGIAQEIEVETTHEGMTSRFKMNYDEFVKNAENREIEMAPLEPTGTVEVGTKITLRGIRRFQNRSIDIENIRRGLARRFSIIGEAHHFEILINDKPISPVERNLQRLLDKDASGKPYLWEYDAIEIQKDTGWRVTGWIGALDRTNRLEDGIQRGIVIMARGKLVQEPFTFNAVVGQQFALSYLVGELQAEFVDEVEDTIGTTRNSLVWDTEANRALMAWGEKEVNRIAREWAQKRSEDNKAELEMNPVYAKFVQEASRFGNSRIRKVADELVRGILAENPVAEQSKLQSVVQLCIDFMEFDAFNDFAQELAAANLVEVDKLIGLFREWEIIEAKEMMRVTQGRIATIEKLQDLIKTNALEVPTLHAFLKEFPWVIDPRWTLVADEKRYSQLLNEQFPVPSNVPDKDRRIDFLCVKESNNLVVIEIKRPQSIAGTDELEQIEEYVAFMRDHVQKTTDQSMKHKEVVGYLLCGNLVDTFLVRQRVSNLEKASIYVRLYSDLLRMVEAVHTEFLERYNQLREAKKGR